MRSGYTLVELLVALAVIGISALVAGPALGRWYSSDATPSQRGLLRQAQSMALEQQVVVDVLFGWRSCRYELRIIGEVEVAVGELEGCVRGEDSMSYSVRFMPTGSIYVRSRSVGQLTWELSLEDVMPWAGAGRQ